LNFFENFAKKILFIDWKRKVILERIFLKIKKIKKAPAKRSEMGAFEILRFARSS